MPAKLISRLGDISGTLALLLSIAAAGDAGVLLAETGWIPEWLGVLLSVFVFGAVLVAIRFIWGRETRRLTRAEEDPGEKLRRRVKQVNAAFTEAAKLMEDLGRDLESQQAARDALLAEAERQQRLLEINKEEAEKIRRILVGETKATIRAERRQQWMFFVLGVLVSAAASVPIGIWVNHIS